MDANGVIKIGISVRSDFLMTASVTPHICYYYNFVVVDDTIPACITILLYDIINTRDTACYYSVRVCRSISTRVIAVYNNYIFTIVAIGLGFCEK